MQYLCLTACRSPTSPAYSPQSKWSGHDQYYYGPDQSYFACSGPVIALAEPRQGREKGTVESGSVLGWYVSPITQEEVKISLWGSALRRRSKNPTSHTITQRAEETFPLFILKQPHPL